MVKARPGGLIAAFLIGFAVVFVGLQFAQNQAVNIPAPAIIPVLLVGFAAVVGWLGWRVRQFIRGKTSMEPIAAARVAALAVTAAYVGALTTGVGLAEVLAVVDRIDAPAARGDATVGASTIIASAVLIATALLIQRWCEIPDDPGDQPEED